MSIKIRLAKVGKRNAPAYKIVVANTRDKRNGRFLEVLGHYNPSVNPVSFELNEKAMDEWIGKGAQVTDAVKDLREGKYEFVKYNPAESTEPEAQEDTHETEEADEPVEDQDTQEE